MEPINTRPTLKVRTEPQTGNPFVKGAVLSSRQNICFGDSATGCFARANDSEPSAPIGGHLQLFHHQWEHSACEHWILRTVAQGLFLEFQSTPPTCFLHFQVPLLETRRLLMETELPHLIAINAIEQVPPSQEGTGFYSMVFLVSKSLGGHRGILNLKYLNQFVLYCRFKMQSLVFWHVSDKGICCNR